MKLPRLLKQYLAKRALEDSLWAMTEQWRPVPNYDGLYEVSNLGRVRSLHARHHEPKVLCLGTDHYGYSTVMLSKDHTRKPFTVHRLVALAFHGEKRNVLHREVAHLDGSKTNARADNLKWVSKVENESHKIAHGTRHSAMYSRLTEDQVRQIKALRGTKTYAAVAEQFGISFSTVDHIYRGNRWKHVTAAATIARSAL